MRVPDELLHQLRFRKQEILNRVSSEEAVLHSHERGLPLLGGAAGDERQIGHILSVLCKEDAPAHIRHGHHVIVTRVDVQSLRGEGAGADVEDRREPLP